MGSKHATGVAPRSRIPVPSYPTRIVGGLALSLTMGMATSCGGDPGIYRHDAATVIGQKPDAGGNPWAPTSDAAMDAGAVDGGAEGLDAASK